MHVVVFAKFAILTSLLLLLLNGCETKAKPYHGAEKSIDQMMKNVEEEHLQTIEYQGCEYIVFEHAPTSAQGYGFMAHKGNCKNPIHKQNSCDEKKK